MRSVRSRFVGEDDSLSERMRLRRWMTLMREFPDLEQMRVLDLGGTTASWSKAPVRPKSVTIINLREPEEAPWAHPIRGDACDAPRLVNGERFDLVFSNSLIEHLGGHAARARFAEATRSLAPRYVVQTPYRYFPVEPHWLFPAMQFLPLNARAWLARSWPVGQTYGWEANQALDEVMFTELLCLTSMQVYFPDASIHWEYFAGLRKSMTAIR